MKYCVIGATWMLTIIMFSWATVDIFWLKRDCKFYTPSYTAKDTASIDACQKLIKVERIYAVITRALNAYQA